MICEQKGIDFIPNLISKKFFKCLKTKEITLLHPVNWSNKWKGLELLKAIINDPKMQKFNFVLIGKNLSYSDFKTKNVRIFDLVDNFNEYVNLISNPKLLMTSRFEYFGYCSFIALGVPIVAYSNTGVSSYLKNDINI